MKNLYCFLLVISIFMSGLAQQNEFLRTYSLPGTREEANAIISTLDGNYLATGYLTVSGANKDLLVVKVDSVGEIIWSYTYGGSLHDVALDVSQPDSNSFIITGYTTSYGAGGYDIYVIKINNSGDLVWEKTFGDIGSDIGNSIICTSDNNLLIVGEKEIASILQLYLLKIDTAGNMIWEQDFGGASSESGNSVVETYGGYVITGSTESYRAVGIGADLYLLKTDTSGNELWYKVFGGSFNDYGTDLIITPDSCIVIAGSFTQGGATNTDVFVIKTDSLGNHIWDNKTGDGMDQNATSIIQTYDDNYVISGKSYPNTNPDIYLLKVDAGGSVLWERFYGEEGTNDAANCVFEDFDSNLVSTGIIQPDLYISKMNSDGCFYFKPTLIADTVICDSVPEDITVGTFTDYQWSNLETTDLLSVVTPGEYWVRVEDDNSCPAYSDTITLIDGTPWFTLGNSNSDSICYGDIALLSAIMVSPDTAYNYTYLWSTSDTTNNISVNTAGNYSIQLTNTTLACMHSESQKIFVAMPKEQQISMITQDSVGNNKIVWEKTPDEAIVSYQIFKTITSDNNYQIAGEISSDSVACFIDLTSGQDERYSYYVSTIDTCGNDFISNYHKMLNLEFDSLNNFSANAAHFTIHPYQIENDTLEILKYYIYRGYSKDSLEIYDSLYSNVTKYIDWDPATTTDTFYYQIIGKTAITCNLNANILNSDTLYTDTLFNKVFSNIQPNWKEPTVSVSEITKLPKMRIFPNPFTGSTTIQFANPNMSLYHLALYDISGKIMKKIDNIKSYELQLDCDDLSSGYYFVELRGEYVYKAAIIIK